MLRKHTGLKTFRKIQQPKPKNQQPNNNRNENYDAMQVMESYPHVLNDELSVEFWK